MEEQLGYGRPPEGRFFLGVMRREDRGAFGGEGLEGEGMRKF